MFNGTSSLLMMRQRALLNSKRCGTQCSSKATRDVPQSEIYQSGNKLPHSQRSRCTALEMGITFDSHMLILLCFHISDRSLCIIELNQYKKCSLSSKKVNIFCIGLAQWCIKNDLKYGSTIRWAYVNQTWCPSRARYISTFGSAAIYCRFDIFRIAARLVSL